MYYLCLLIQLSVVWCGRTVVLHANIALLLEIDRNCMGTPPVAWSSGRLLVHLGIAQERVRECL